MHALHCDMSRDCAAPVSHIDARGFVYCATHGPQRAANGDRCRALAAWELREIRAGRPISYERKPGKRGGPFPGPWSLKQRRDGLYNVYSAPHDVALCVHADNAPLVRAAPDLLRALQRLADCPDLNLEDLEPETCEAIAQAQAALAMAADGLP